MAQDQVLRVEEILRDVRYPGHCWRVAPFGDGVYLQISYMEPDVETGEFAAQRGRKWYISPHATRSEVVQTALKAALTSAKHRVREHFLYKGKRIFGPHFDPEQLCERPDALDVRPAPPEKAATQQPTLITKTMLPDYPWDDQ